MWRVGESEAETALNVAFSCPHLPSEPPNPPPSGPIPKQMVLSEHRRKNHTPGAGPLAGVRDPVWPEQGGKHQGGAIMPLLEAGVDTPPASSVTARTA